MKFKGEGEQWRVKSLSSRAEFKNPFSNLRLELKSGTRWSDRPVPLYTYNYHILDSAFRIFAIAIWTACTIKNAQQ